jgi:signal transduction histidine kinase
MDLVQEAVAVIGVLAEDKEQTLSVTGDQRVLVSADRAFLRMALVNLLDNAVKYSPTGRLGKRRPLRSGAQLHPRYLSRAGIDRTWLPFRTQHG